MWVLCLVEMTYIDTMLSCSSITPYALFYWAYSFSLWSTTTSIGKQSCSYNAPIGDCTHREDFCTSDSWSYDSWENHKEGSSCGGQLPWVCSEPGLFPIFPRCTSVGQSRCGPLQDWQGNCQLWLPSWSFPVIIFPSSLRLVMFFIWSNLICWGY